MNNTDQSALGHDREPRRFVGEGRLLPVVLLILLIGIGIGLRFRHIGEKSLWYDEAFSLAIVDQESIGDVVNVCRDSVHPPAFHVFLYLPFQWSRSIGWLRGWNAFLGVGAIVAAYFLGTALRDRATGLFLAGGMAISPLAVHYSQELRMYALLSLLTLIQLFLAVRWTEKPTFLMTLGVAFVSALAILTQYYAIFLTAAMMGFLLLWTLVRLGKQGLIIFGILAGFLLVFLLPWLDVLIQHGQRNTLAGPEAREMAITWNYLWNVFQDWTLGPVPVGFLSVITHYAYRAVVLDVLLGVLVSFAVLALGIWSLMSGRRAPCRPADTSSTAIRNRLFFGCILGGTILITLFHIAFLDGRFYSRYGIVLLPLLLFGFSEGVRWFSQKWIQVFWTVILVAGFFPSSMALGRVDARDVMLTAHRTVAFNSGSGDLVIHSNPWSYLPFRFYSDRFENEFLWESDRITPVDRVVIDSSRILSTLPEWPSKRGWLVASEWSMDDKNPLGDRVLEAFDEGGWRLLKTDTSRRGLKWVEIVLLEQSTNSRDASTSPSTALEKESPPDVP